MFESLYKFITDNPQTFVATAAAIIAAGSAIFNIYSFRYKNRKENLDADKKLKIDWLKSLVLDYNLENFYDFFDKVTEEMKKLQGEVVTEDIKKQVIESINDYRISLRRKFIDLLLAVDDNLYNSTLDKVDQLIDGFTIAIADEGINLKNMSKFEEVVLNKITESRTDIIKGFFNYKGEEKQAPNAIIAAKRKLGKYLSE